MSKPKLLQILEKLSTAEIKRFQSHFRKNHPKSSAKQEILDDLVKLHPHYGNSKEVLKKMDQKIAANYSEGKRFSNELSKLKPFLEDFLIAEYAKEDQLERNSLLLKVYLKHGLKEQYQSKLKEVDRQLDLENKDLWHWVKKMQVKHEAYFNPLVDQKLITADSIYQALDQAHQFHSAAQLRYASELYNRHIILKEPLAPLPGLDQWVTAALASPSLFHQAYALSVQLCHESDDEIYFLLKEKILKNIDQFQQRDLYILFTYLCNYIAQRVRNGQQLFLQEQFEIMEFCIPHEVFISDGTFNHAQFINIVDTGSKLGKFVWVQGFIKQWKSYLLESIREVTLLLTDAYIFFHQKDFGQAVQLANEIKTKDIQIEMRRRWLILQAFYEQKDFQYWESNIKTYETFVRRKGKEAVLNETHLKAAMKVSHFMKRLNKLNPDKEKLATDLEAAKPIFLKIWFQEKIDQLK